jgi:hypothetical protein
MLVLIAISGNRCAGGRASTALAAELAPPAQFAVGVAILHLAFHLQFRGDFVMAAISVCR